MDFIKVNTRYEPNKPTINVILRDGIKINGKLIFHNYEYLFILEGVSLYDYDTAINKIKTIHYSQIDTIVDMYYPIIKGNREVFDELKPYFEDYNNFSNNKINQVYPPELESIIKNLTSKEVIASNFDPDDVYFKRFIVGIHYGILKLNVNNVPLLYITNSDNSFVKFDLLHFAGINAGMYLFQQLAITLLYNRFTLPLTFTGLNHTNQPNYNGDLFGISGNYPILHSNKYYFSSSQYFLNICVEGNLVKFSDKFAVYNDSFYKSSEVINNHISSLYKIGISGNYRNQNINLSCHLLYGIWVNPGRFSDLGGYRTTNYAKYISNFSFVLKYEIIL